MYAHKGMTLCIRDYCSIGERRERGREGEGYYTQIYLYQCAVGGLKVKPYHPHTTAIQ